jgi:hypothetical protein
MIHQHGPLHASGMSLVSLDDGLAGEPAICYMIDRLVWLHELTS